MSRQLNTLAQLVVKVAANLQKSVEEVLADISNIIKDEAAEDISAEDLKKYNKFRVGTLHALYALLHGAPSGGQMKRLELTIHIIVAVKRNPDNDELRSNLKKLPLSKVRDLLGKLVTDRDDQYELAMGKDRAKMANAIIKGFRSMKL